MYDQQFVQDLIKNTADQWAGILGPGRPLAPAPTGSPAPSRETDWVAAMLASLQGTGGAGMRLPTPPANPTPRRW